jgi:aryl-alcohol dehydrogenase-like predicted oxidoreductase
MPELTAAEPANGNTVTTNLPGAVGARHWPRLGFGVSGPHSTALVSQKHTLKLIVEAARLGLGYLDTAPAYGQGEAERRVGLGLKAIADAGLPRPLVSTKAGVWSLPNGRKWRQFSLSAIERGLEESLSRLGTDSVDILILHGPSAGELTDPLLAGLQAIKASGQVKALGAACRGPEADSITGLKLFDALMLPLQVQQGPDGKPCAADPHCLNRAMRASRAGLTVLGIEVMSEARNRSSFTPGGIYRLARQLSGRGASKASELSTADALHWAWAQSPQVCVVSTTTTLRHLRANAAELSSLTA